MTIRIPEGERSKQLDYYHRVTKHKLATRPKNTKYNGGQPRANLTLLPTFNRRLAERLYDIKSRCAREGIPFDLDAEWAAAQKPFCAVTGASLILPNDHGPLTANIDRVIPANGYVKSNVQLVAAWFNQAKLHWDNEQIQNLIVTAAKHITLLRSTID